MIHTAGRKVFLLIDICFAHGSESFLPDLQNFEVYFFQPSTTTKIKLLDGGIIYFLMPKLGRKVPFSVSENIASGRKSFRNVSVFTEMSRVSEELEGLSPESIKKFFEYLFSFSYRK